MPVRGILKETFQCETPCIKNLCSGTHRFQFLLILDLWGVSFHAAVLEVVFGLGKDFLFKFTLGHCVLLITYSLEQKSNLETKNNLFFSTKMSRFFKNGRLVFFVYSDFQTAIPFEQIETRSKFLR